jgi:hypothetical protein
VREKGTSAVILSDKKRERQWKKGEHTDADGNVYRLEDMETSHLRNTIKGFRRLELNTKPLELELKRREVKEYFDSVERVLKWLEGCGSAEETEKLRRSARKARKALSAYWDKYTSQKD